MSEELKLIRQIQKKRDRTSANSLINLYYKDIYAYVYKQTNNREVSLDLTQEIFIGMMRSIVDFDYKKASFKTWLYKIAMNKIIDYYRSKHYRIGDSISCIDDYEFQDDFNIEDNFILSEEVKDIMDLINRMESNIQQIIRLKIFSEMTFGEIALTLEINESTVKTKYYSAVRKLSRILRGGNNE